jgi:hypothetical protein
MGQSSDDPLKKKLAELAEQVSGLPEHLQQAAFTTLLNRELDSLGTARDNLHSETIEKLRHQPSPTLQPADSFGEYYATFPQGLSEDQKLLVAASFAEAQSSDRTYTAEQAHDLLKGIGIKSTNVGVYAKRLVKPKGWAITVGKAGRKTYNFRVSNQGHKELKRLKESQP